MAVVHAYQSATTTEVAPGLKGDKHYIQDATVTLRMLAPEVTGAMGGQAGPHSHAESEVTNLAADLAGRALTIHEHDYATSGHTHATYAASAHNHDGTYSAPHAHPYSSDSHNHDVAYAPTHAHPYSATAHNHDAAYATGAHVHDYSATYSTVAHTHASYAATSHNHDVAYAAAVHAHAAAAPVYAALANQTAALALGTNNVVKVTPTGNITFTTTVPPAGSERRVLILTSGSSTFTCTFGTGFKPVGTLATGATTARVFAIGFVSDGTSLYETGRTAAMVA